MASRLELQAELERILGSENVYYQPPESTKIVYPAIVYERSDIKSDHADDSCYIQQHYYRVTFISYDQDNDVVELLSKIKTARYIRHYVVDKLYHDTFTIAY